jgi:hypothetical protein
MLHHIPMVEFVLGRLRSRLRPATRVGFIEPDFRILLARLSYLETTGRPELAPLRIWAMAINQLYAATRISPHVGASLDRTLAAAGYQRVSAHWSEGRSDALMIENMRMFYEEVRERLIGFSILTAEEIDHEQRVLPTLPSDNLPAVWGIHRVTCVT